MAANGREKLSAGRTPLILLACTALASCASLYAQTPSASTTPEAFESLPMLNATTILQPRYVAGPNFTVPTYSGSKQYKMDSDYGVFTADGNAMLMRRVAEIQGIAALQAMSQTSEFTQAAAQAAETPLNVAQDLVTNPLPTIASVPRGILSFLNQAGQAVKAAKELRKARSTRASTKERLGHYLQAAAEAGPLLGQGAEAPAVRDIYNAATAELTVLLRSADGGRLWNHPLTITAGGTRYQLYFAPASRQEGTWAPGYFTAFETPKQVREKRIRLQVRDAGFGGTLVGINRPADPAKFYFPSVGVAAAVTAVLDFKPPARSLKAPRDVVLSLHDPTLRETVRIAGATRPLAADFTAPLAYYPHPLFLGLMEAMRVDRYYRTAGLTMLQPYDPERIPIVFVHGLISEPGMWRDTIDAVESDPVLRGRFQFWTFGYPTGDPISISALQLRESLAGVYRLYPRTQDMVLVSHSLGAIGVSLIHLPAQVVDNIQSQIGHSLAVIGGRKGFVFPPSVHGLSPKSTLLHALDKRPIQVPHHTIAGDRGKADTPKSSDGVVLYRSSHLDSAQSELIVPGPHGSFDLPQTVAEIQRILHLHLQAHKWSREPRRPLKVNSKATSPEFSTS